MPRFESGDSVWLVCDDFSLLETPAQPRRVIVSMYYGESTIVTYPIQPEPLDQNDPFFFIQLTGSWRVATRDLYPTREAALYVYERRLHEELRRLYAKADRIARELLQLRSGWRDPGRAVVLDAIPGKTDLRG